MSYFDSLYGDTPAYNNLFGKKRRKKSKSKKKRSAKKSNGKKMVEFRDSRTGKMVRFRARSSKKRRGSSPRHLKTYNNRMKELSVRYNNGDFGNMKWTSVIKKYMTKKSPRKSRSRRRSRRRSSRR